jgi:hypothetical protein
MLVAAQAKYPGLRLRWTVLLMIASIVPSWLCHRFIENPVRFGTPFKPTWRALGLGAALTAVGVLVGAGLSASVAVGTVVKEAAPSQAVGAAALADPANAGKVWSDLKAVESMRPLPVDAPDDRPAFYSDGSGCQVSPGNPTPKLCESGDTSSDRSVVIIGDSKIAQWQTVLSAIGKREHWKLVQITKSACAFTDAYVISSGKPWPDCRQWGQTALKDILRIKPELVITSERAGDALPPGKSGVHDESQDGMVQGLASYWRTITDAGIPLAALLDNPAPVNGPVYECVASHQKDLRSCVFDESKGLAASGALAQRKAAAQVPAVKVVDMTDVICPDKTRCAPVIGNVLVYRQGSHLTRTFINSTEPQLAARLYRATGGKLGSL